MLGLPSACRQETWIAASQAEGNSALGRNTNLKLLCPGITTAPFQGPAGLWPSILAKSQPSTSPCQHYPPMHCAKAQDQSPSPKPEQLSSLSAKYLAPLPAAVVKSAKGSSPSVNPFSPLPCPLQVPMANIISSAKGFSFFILEK